MKDTVHNILIFFFNTSILYALAAEKTGLHLKFTSDDTIYEHDKNKKEKDPRIWGKQKKGHP